MPKLLSRHVYSALLVLDVSAPSEPVGTRWALGEMGREKEENSERKVKEEWGGGREVAVV